MKHAEHAFTIAFVIGKGTGALEGKDPILSSAQSESKSMMIYYFRQTSLYM